MGHGGRHSISALFGRKPLTVLAGGKGKSLNLKTLNRVLRLYPIHARVLLRSMSSQICEGVLNGAYSRQMLAQYSVADSKRRLAII